MKKRAAIIITPILLLSALIVYALWIPRSMGRMEQIAVSELQNILGPSFKTTHNLKGPLIDTTHADFVRFQWYRPLDWGDTASVYVDVYKSLGSFSWRDYYFWPSVTMNHQWRYMSGPRARFEDVLPSNYENRPEILSRLHLHADQKKYYGDAEISMDPKWLFHFLKEGYFEVLDKQPEHTEVAFYQPIGRVPMKTASGVEMEKTFTAIVAVNDAAEVVIVPSDYDQRKYPQ